MGRTQDARTLRNDAEQAAAEPCASRPGTWALRAEGPDRLILTFRGHVTPSIASHAVEEIASVLVTCAQPTVVVADMLEVDGFDPRAPVAALRAALPARPFITSVELVVAQRAVQLAALAAAHVLGLPCTVRHARPAPLRGVQP